MHTPQWRLAAEAAATAEEEATVEEEATEEATEDQRHIVLAGRSNPRQIRCEYRVRLT